MGLAHAVCSRHRRVTAVEGVRSFLWPQTGSSARFIRRAWHGGNWRQRGTHYLADFERSTVQVDVHEPISSMREMRMSQWLVWLTKIAPARTWRVISLSFDVFPRVWWSCGAFFVRDKRRTSRLGRIKHQFRDGAICDIYQTKKFFEIEPDSSRFPPW